MQLEVSDRVYRVLCSSLSMDIQSFYDEPFGHGDDQKAWTLIHEDMRVLKETAAALKLDFDKLINKVVSPFERARMNLIMTNEWSFEILDDIEDLFNDETLSHVRPCWTDSDLEVASNMER